MVDLMGRKDPECLVGTTGLPLPTLDDLEESEPHVLRGLYFAAGPTAVFWIGLILAINWLLR